MRIKFCVSLKVYLEITDDIIQIKIDDVLIFRETFLADIFQYVIHHADARLCAEEAVLLDLAPAATSRPGRLHLQQ